MRARDQSNTVKLLISEDGNRAAVRDLLDGHFDVETEQSVGEADLYLVDDHTFPRHHEALRECVERTDPVFCPVILIRRRDSALRIDLPDPSNGEAPLLIDDIVDAPLDPPLLFRRMNTLLVRRAQSEDLLHYITRLEESNQSLEQFAYAASHDLQEPLRMVSSYLQLLDQRYGDAFDEDGAEFLEYAVDGADRMREMIDALLEYSRIDTEGDPMEPVALEGVLDDVFDDLQLKIEETDARIDVDDLPRVRGDADQLRQLFQNLLSNAIEYSGDEPPHVRVSAERDGTTWQISVEDEGIGIDPDDQERIFEVFQRLHGREEHPGTGIGLAICKRIVERHDGRIRVESEPGAGLTFTFSLPAADATDA